MGVNSQSKEGEGQFFKERNNSNTPQALYNPDKPIFQSIVGLSTYKILDIGCGDPPRLSWGVTNPNQLWVGCDPAINLQKNERLIDVSSPFKGGIKGKLVVFGDIADEVPQFQPDIISLVSPNPKDIYDENVLSYDLEKFLRIDSKRQHLAIVLDNITFQAAQYRKPAMERIYRWMERFHFEEIDKPTFPCEFRPNSVLGPGRSTSIYGERVFKKRFF
jgi:hypothetical protein